MRIFPGAVVALRRFFAINAAGDFSNSSLHAALQRARAEENAWRAKHDRPPIPDVRPYDFRHTFGTELAKRIRTSARSKTSS